MKLLCIQAFFSRFCLACRTCISGFQRFWDVSFEILVPPLISYVNAYSFLYTLAIRKILLVIKTLNIRDFSSLVAIEMYKQPFFWCHPYIESTTVLSDTYSLRKVKNVTNFKCKFTVDNLNEISASLLLGITCNGFPSP